MTKKREFQNTISLAAEVVEKSKEELAELRVQEDGFREREKVLARKKVRHFCPSNNGIDRTSI
jgi:hypothetical protein